MENKKCPECNCSKIYIAELCDDFSGRLTCANCNHKFYKYVEPAVQTETLYTTADVARTRQKLLKEQGGMDALTGLEIPPKQAVCDHNHRTQYVRGILHRQSNAVLGRIENMWTRYLAYWYEGTLSDFLRKAADYLEKPDDTRYVHPGWIKRVTTDFRKLKAKEQLDVLAELGYNAVKPNDRVVTFQKAIKSKKFSFEQIRGFINEVKE